jgi:hypothetical protein
MFNQKLEKIYEVLKEIVGDSTGHGLPHLAKDKQLFIKIMWFIMWIISLGLFAYLFYLSLIQFLSFQKVVQSVDYTETASPFPTVTFCNLNPFQTTDSLSK